MVWLAWPSPPLLLPVQVSQLMPSTDWMVWLAWPCPPLLLAQVSQLMPPTDAPAIMATALSSPSKAADDFQLKVRAGGASVHCTLSL